MATDKFIIYQLLIRVFGNNNENCIPNGSFSINGSGKFSSITNDILCDIKKLNATHIWYTGVIEHSTKSDFSLYGIKKDYPGIIKGEAGSPYAIKDYYDVNPYLADDVYNRMGEFEALIKRTHNNNLKVIIDFVPNHLSRDYFSDSAPIGVMQFGQNDNINDSFNPNNNFYYLPNQQLDLSNITSDNLTFKEFPCKVTGNDCFNNKPTSNDWYETVKLNYGVDYLRGGVKYFNPIPDTWIKMRDILLFWASKGVDGFRCDMAEMVPVEFWNWCINQIKKDFPSVIFIAEVYNPSLYESYIYNGGFDFLYDKVGMYDTLKLISQGILPASSITSVWQSLGVLQNKMLNFLENHDEQRVASDFNLGNSFKSIPELVVSLMFNSSPFMLYFGEEFGERGMLQEGFSGIDGRTSIFDYCSAPSVVRYLNGSLLDAEKELYCLYQTLFNFAMNTPAISGGEIYDLEYANLDNPLFNSYSTFVFARKDKNSVDESFYIIAVDFSQSLSSTNILLPQHLFSFWDLTQGKYNISDILIGEKNSRDIYPNSKLDISFNKNGIAIYFMQPQ